MNFKTFSFSQSNMLLGQLMFSWQIPFNYSTTWETCLTAFLAHSFLADIKHSFTWWSLNCLSLVGVLSVKKYAKISLQMVSPDGLSKTHTYGVYMATKHNPVSKEIVWPEQRLVISLKILNCSAISHIRRQLEGTLTDCEYWFFIFPCMWIFNYCFST